MRATEPVRGCSLCLIRASERMKAGSLLLTIAVPTTAHGRRCLPWTSYCRVASSSPSAAHGPRSCVLFGLASHTNITTWGCHAQSGCEGSPNRRGGAGATARANSSAYAGAAASAAVPRSLTHLLLVCPVQNSLVPPVESKRDKRTDELIGHNGESREAARR